MEQFSPGLFNYDEALKRCARESLIHNFEALFNDGMARERAATEDAMIRGGQGMIENALNALGGGGSPNANEPGEASPPATRGRGGAPLPGIGL